MASCKNGRIWNGAGAAGGGFSLMSLVLCCVALFSSTVFLTSTMCEAVDPCSDYTTKDDEWRDVTNTNQSDTSQCDKDLFQKDRWYAFTIAGERAQIPTECIKNNMCGTKVPMRVNLLGQSHPATEGETVTAEVCSSYDILGKFDCCVLRSRVVIAKCGDTFVYQFEPSFDRCPVAVCSQKMDEPLPKEVTAKMGEIYPGSPASNDKKEVVIEDDEGDDTITEQATLSFDNANKTDDSTELNPNSTTDLSVGMLASNVSRDPGNSSVNDTGSSPALDSGFLTPGTTPQLAQQILASESPVDDQNSTISSPNQTQSMDAGSGEDKQNTSDWVGALAGIINTTLPVSRNVSSFNASTLENVPTNTSSAVGAPDSNSTSTPKSSAVATTSSLPSTGPPAGVSTFMDTSGSSQQPSSLLPTPDQSLGTTMTETSQSVGDDTTTTVKQKPVGSPTRGATVSIQGVAKTTDGLPTTSSPSTPATTESLVKATTTTPSITTGTTLSSTLSSSSSLPSTQSLLPSVAADETSTETDDMIYIEMVRLVFKGNYHQVDNFALKVYTLVESFLRRATRNDDSDWWFQLFGDDQQPMSFENTTTYIDMRIKHTSQEKIIATFDRLQLDNFFAMHANLTLLTVCRPSQNCQEGALDIKPQPSVFEENAPVFIAVITLCVFCLVVMIIGMVCSRYRRRGSYIAEDDHLDTKNSDNNHFSNGNQSPFTDEQIMKDEVADTTSFNGSAMDGDDTNDNTWVIPLDDAPVGGDTTAKATEDTKL